MVLMMKNIGTSIHIISSQSFIARKKSHEALQRLKGICMLLCAVNENHIMKY